MPSFTRMLVTIPILEHTSKVRILKLLKKLKPKSWKHFFFVAGCSALGLFVVLILVVLYYAIQLPDPSIIMVRRVNESTKIYDRTGEHLLYDVHGEEKRTEIAWDQISQHVKNATLAAEDTDFYKH